MRTELLSFTYSVVGSGEVGEEVGEEVDGAVVEADVPEMGGAVVEADISEVGGAVVEADIPEVDGAVAESYVSDSVCEEEAECFGWEGAAGGELSVPKCEEESVECSAEELEAAFLSKEEAAGREGRRGGMGKLASHLPRRSNITHSNNSQFPLPLSSSLRRSLSCRA